jgi:acetyl esterase
LNSAVHSNILPAQSATRHRAGQPPALTEVVMNAFRASVPDGESQWVLDLAAKGGRPRLDSHANAADARAQFVSNSKPLDMKPIEMAAVVDHRIKDATGAQKMLLRDYRPRSAPTKDAAALLFIHGGGFVVGSPDTHDSICRLLADRSGVRFFSVDYRMGPENPFPAAPDDCRAAWNWLVANAAELGIDKSRLAVGGDSAGGNLSAVLALELRDAPGPMPILQLLIYPSVDMRASSVRDPALEEGYLLDRKLVDWFHGHYLGNSGDVDNWRVSPLLAKSHKGLPTAYLVTGGYDIIGLQGAVYGDKLRQSGVRVSHAHYPGMLHGFCNMAGALKGGRAAIEAMGAFVRDELARKE